MNNVSIDSTSIALEKVKRWYLYLLILGSLLIVSGIFAAIVQ
jgi:hypothetical protein